MTTTLPLEAPRRRAGILAALTLLTVPLARASHAAIPPPLPEANPYVEAIVEITPPEAPIGSTVVVRTEPSAAARFVQQIAPTRRLGITIPTLPPAPGTAAPAVPNIYFRGIFGPRIPGRNVTSLGNHRWSVVVPDGTIGSGVLRFETALGNSYSTVNFTVLNFGYTVANLSQFNIVSIKVDNTEHLVNRMVPAVPESAPNVNVADVAAPTAGNHSVQITLGPSAGEPVIVYFLPSVQATNPTNVIEVSVMLAGEYLVASSNATTNGNNVTASWQTLVVHPDGTVSVNGFDFTHNTATGDTTWANWIGDRSNVMAGGPITESSWTLNPTSKVLELRRGNGSFFTNLTIDLLDKSFVADDGFTFELQ